MERSKLENTVEQRFLDDVAHHEIEIVHDKGVVRHLRFRGSMCHYWFDLITWNNVLCINGDCGTYVFSRIEDMFKFFRMNQNDWNYNSNGLSINSEYWHEKCISESKAEKIRSFSSEKFEKAVREYFTEQSCNLDGSAQEELWAEIVDEVLWAENNHDAHTALRDFKHLDFEFVDTWEWDFTEYTTSYLWCLYAIVWGIRKYDESGR